MSKFNTKEEVDEYFNGDRIKCLICGRWLRAVGGKHLVQHNISVEEYKEMFGLPQSRGLVCSETAERQRIALQERKDAGDTRLLSLTPEVMDKARHAPRHTHPPYHLNQMREFAENGREVLMARAEERAANIDWDAVIEAMEDQGVALWTLTMPGGAPSEYDLARKKQSDPVFAKKYEAIVEQNKKYTQLKERVVILTKEGLTQREIAVALQTSKTHVARMQKKFINKRG